MNVSDGLFKRLGIKSGHTYEGTVDTLSESEREVLGLVFALAGYLVHKVYEQFPFILLDLPEVSTPNGLPNLLLSVGVCELSRRCPVLVSAGVSIVAVGTRTFSRRSGGAVYRTAPCQAS